MIRNLLYLSSEFNLGGKSYQILKVNFSLLPVLNQCPGYVGSIILADSDPLFPNSKNGFQV